jgi:hypothetical protein
MLLNSLSIMSVFLLLLAGCATVSPTSAPQLISSETPTLDFSQYQEILPASPTPGQPGIATATSTPAVSSQQAVLDEAFIVVNSLMHQDMHTLAQYVDPIQGLRFSPYASVKDTDQVFTTEQVPGLMADNTIYLWGNYDGSGEPINLTFSDYYAKFIYDENFGDAPQISLNHRLGTGNSIDNSQDYYPGAKVVEFYFPGFDPQYNGMDWRSLRLVFTQESQTWYLAGIIHDHWTI